MPTDAERSFVCCLSSLNVAQFDQWKDTNIVQDLTRFLDNVIQSFINNAPDMLKCSKYSAEQERGIGIGTLGLHTYLQSKGIPFESGGFGSASQQCSIIYKLIKERAVEESLKLGSERGEAPDMIGTGRRNSVLLAIAPNANSADIIGVSPSTELNYRNVYLKSTRAGNFIVKNKMLELRLQQLGLDSEEIWESIRSNHGSVQHIEELSEHDKKVYKTAIEVDQHWVVELANIRGEHVCQAQSTNLYFPFGASRQYVNSVHMKYLASDNVYTLYYYRTEREVAVDNAKDIKRVALKDWQESAPESACLSCEG